MPKIRKKLGIGSRDSASFGPIIHFEQLEQRIMLSGNGLLSSALNQDKDAILDNNLEIVQEAELLHKEVQDEEQISLEPITSDTTNNEVYQPICTLLPGDENNDKLADDELSVDDYNPTLIGDVLAVLSNNPECDIDGKIIETQESVIPIYDSDADLSKEYATSIEIRGPPAQDQGAYRNQILFIDSALKHYLQLDNAASSDVEVIALPAEQDGIQYISNIISYYDNVSALHIMTHGALGRLKFGMAELTQASFDQYTDALEIWSDALAVDGDLLLYGCSVAQSDAGQAFINRIAELTGADVAASIDLTGSAALGGDWVLERMTGPIEASVLGMSLVADFQGLLQDDHGDNAASSTAVLVPSSTAGDIEVLGDVDWFRFSAIAGTEYTFETVLGTLSDSVLTLIHTNGVTQIVFDDDSGGGLASRIEWTAPVNGTYYLEVGSFDDTYTGTYSLEITSDSVQPGLTLSIAQASISESGGVSQATVTRSPGTSGSLTVTLTSSDTTEATVPSTVTIPDGASVATFTVTGVDDAVVDGTQMVTITASATGYTNGTDMVQVLDNESGDDHGNNAALSTAVLVPSVTQGNIEVGTDVDWFRFTAIAGTNYTFETILGTLQDSQLTLFGTDGVTQIAFDDDSGGELASRIEWTAPVNGTYYLEVGSFDDTYTGTYSLEITSDSVQPGLTLSIAQASISESGGVSQATVTRSPGTSGSLTVTLTSSDTTEATVPSTVTIPDGIGSALFTVTGVDDSIVDGTQTVTIIASALGYTNGVDTIDVSDDDLTPTVDLIVTKTESTDPVVAGSGTGNLAYVVTVTNNGPSDATGVMLNENLTLPSGVTIDSIVPSVGSYAGNTWTVGDLAVGTSETLTITLTVDSSALSCTDTISNTASVTAVNETDSNPANDSATESTSVIREVDLVVINMESIDPVIAGSGTGNLVYVVTVTNNGPSDATGITIFEDLTLPAGVSVDSVVPYSGVYTMTTAPDGIWTLDLVSGFSATLIVALTVGDYTAAGTDVIINTAAVTGTSGGEIIINTGDDTATESTSVSREVDLVVTKIESIDPVVAGSGAGNLVYVITVANNGPSDATNVTISEDLTLPASVSVDSVVPSSGVYTTTTTPDGTWTLDLAAGTSETLTIVMTVDSNTADGAIVSDTVTVTAVNETLINTGDDTASESTSVLHEVVPPVVTVTNPNGGENWPIGSVHDITWNATDNVAVTSIDILYSSSGAGGSFISIANGEANDGMYPWAIPNDPTTNAFVKVIAYDAAGNSAEDLSDGPFTISDQTAPSVTVTAPNGGQDWPLGSVHDITWNGTDNIGVTSIDILYSNNGSSGSFISIASGEANDGTYTWTIPNDPTTNAFVKVIAYDAAGNSGEDLSDGPFTIRMLDTTAPTMVNLSPADDAVGVDPDTDLVIHFSEDVQKGTGNIVIKRASDDLVFEIVDVTAAGVTVSGVVATIDLSTTLVKGTDYYVQVDVGAFMDLATNAFAGISDATTWNFKIVENMAPVITSISNSSPGVGDTAAGQQITVDAQFTDVNTLDNHTAVIDWGDGTITPGQVIESNGSGSVFGSHIYIDGGIYNITLTLTDNYGGLATGNTIAVITGVRVHNGVLQIIGTSKKDHITVNQRRSSHRHGTQFMVHTDFWGGYTTFDADNIDNIVILTGDGNDKVTIARNINVLVLVDGGVGNDNLKGGRGADIVLGAEGNDNLQGGPGRDILIGGDGSDRIIGNSGDDLLIGGPTLFDIDDSNLGQIFVTPGQEFDEALMAILAEWNSERDFDTRVDNLTNGSGSNDRLNGQYFLRQGSTVYDDGLKDHMTGSSGKDWLISFDSNKYHWWRRWDNRGRNLIRHR